MSKYRINLFLQSIVGLLIRSVEQSRWEQPILDSDIVCTPCRLAELTAHIMNTCTLKFVTAFIQSLEPTNSPICLVHIGPCSYHHLLQKVAKYGIYFCSARLIVRWISMKKPTIWVSHKRRMKYIMLEQERQYRHKVTLRRIRVTTIAVKKQIIITYSQCVAVASVIQHAKRMCHIIWSSVTCLAVSVPGLSVLPFKQHDCRRNVIDHKMCVSIFSTNFFLTIFHSKKNSRKYYHTCK
jgi:hypothetical protein